VVVDSDARRMTRSLLFVPGDSEKKIAKAFASEADAVVLDLEDAVAPQQKDRARCIVLEALRHPRQRAIYVRINDFESPYCWDDLLAVAKGVPDAIVLPKSDSCSSLLSIAWILTNLENRSGAAPGSIRLIPLIESARGLSNLSEIVVASPRILRLSFGAIDLALDMGLHYDKELKIVSLAQFALATASRSAGLEAPIDSPTMEINDEGVLRRAARNARQLGFGGKFCIHPAQIDSVNAVFSPSSDEIEFAQGLIAAFDAATLNSIGVIQFEGKMIDKPMVERQRRVLMQAKAATAGKKPAD
jgi:citrate lyase subunit beta / citryl-CoA lyase